MKHHKYLGAVVTVALVGVAAPAAAQQRTGGYIGLDIGIAAVGDVGIAYSDEGGTFGGTEATDTASFDTDLKSALTFGVTAGYDFGTIRADIEVDYHRNELKSLTLKEINGSAVTLTPADAADICEYLESDECSVSGNDISLGGGRLRQASALANLWVDFPVGETIIPYVGGGAGVGGFEIDGEGKARFAWQLGAGVAFNLSPSVALSADYRYRRINGTTITDSEFPEASFRISKLKTNSFTVGVRFLF